jgi:hypothetical protein
MKIPVENLNYILIMEMFQVFFFLLNLFNNHQLMNK